MQGEGQGESAHGKGKITRYVEGMGSLHVDGGMLNRLALLCVLGLLSPLSAWAQEDDHEGERADEAALASFSVADRRTLAPHLREGPVLLVEFNGEAELPGVLLATEVEAPAAAVAAVIGNPQDYPRFMPALTGVDLKSSRTDRRGGRSVAYDWQWHTAMFRLKGRNTMHTQAAPSRRDRPYRIDVSSEGGDFGFGRLTWRVYPTSTRASMIVLSARLDLREANYLTRELTQGQRSVNRTINITLAYVMALATRDRAEANVGFKRKTLNGDAERPALDRNALRPLLYRGDLVFVRENGATPQVRVVGRMARSYGRLRTVMTDPNEFGPAMMPGSYAEVKTQRENTVDFAWGVRIPLIGTRGEMRLTDLGAAVEVEATEGALKSGVWRFEPIQHAGGLWLVGDASFDPASAAWLLRVLIGQNAHFREGIAAGSQVMMLRAVRTRVRAR